MSQVLSFQDFGYNYFVVFDGNLAEVKKAVVIFHGYGADAYSLIDLATSLNLKDVLFIIPEGPEECQGSDDLGIESNVGRQWFDLSNFDLRIVSNLIVDAADDASNFIINCANKYNLNLSDIALFGFSQGAFMSSHLAMKLGHIAGAVSSSGGIFSNVLNYNHHVKVPIVLTHGREDQVLDKDWSELAYETLQKVNDDVSLYKLEGVGHELGEEGFNILKNSLTNFLHLK